MNTRGSQRVLARWGRSFGGARVERLATCRRRIKGNDQLRAAKGSPGAVVEVWPSSRRKMMVGLSLHASARISAGNRAVAAQDRSRHETNDHGERSHDC